MKRTLLLLIGLLTAIVAYPQTDSVNISWDKLRVPKFTSPTIFKTGAATFGGKTWVIMELDPNSTFKIAVYTYSLKEFVDDRDTRITRANTGTGTKTGLFNSTFSYVANTSLVSSYVMQWTGAKIDVWSERFAGHGTYTVWLDDVKVATIDASAAPISTDFTRNQPSFTWEGAQGLHKIELRGAVGQQFILDRFGVYE